MVHGHNDPAVWKPFKFAQIIADHPKSLGAAVLAICLIFAGSVYSIFEFSPQGGRDFRVIGDKASLDLDLIEEAKATIFGEELEDTQDPQSVIRNGWTVIIMYKSAKTDNVLTDANVRQMKKIEDHIKDDPLYDKLCVAKEVNESLICDADQTHASFLAFAGDAPTDDELDSKLEMYSQNLDAFKPIVDTFFDREFTSDNAKSKYTRTFFKFATPLAKDKDGKPYKSFEDRPEEQEAIFDEFSQRVGLWILEQGSTDTMEVYVAGGRYSQKRFQDLTNNDFYYMAGSFGFVFLYVSWHTKSMFLAAATMLQIILAFPMSFLLCWGVLQVTYFAQIHLLAMFILLGVGADDVFVFTDAWAQAKSERPEYEHDVVRRMSFTWRRAGKAMLVTSLTTVAAFMATGISTLVPISSFGIFAACLIASNYVLVITLYPCAVVIQYRYFKNMCKKEASSKPTVANKMTVALTKSPTVPENEPADQNMITSKPIDLQSKQKEAADAPRVKLANGRFSSNIKFGQSKLGEGVSELRPVEKFFETQFAPFIAMLKIPLVIIFSILLVVMSTFAVKLEPPTDAEKWFPDDHPITIGADIMTEKYRQSSSDNTLPVQFIWGPKELDDAHISRWDRGERGDIVWDDDFDLSTTSAQQAFVDSFEKVKESDLVFNGDGTCFMTFYRAWRLAQNKTFPAEFGSGLSNDARKTAFVADLGMFFSTTPLGMKLLARGEVGIQDGKIRYAMWEVTSKVLPQQPYKTTLPEYKAWESLKDEIKDDMPSEMKNVRQGAGQGWVMMMTQYAMTQNAIQGMSIAISFAFVMLIISTQNVLISLYATLTIAGIVSTVFGSLYLMSFSLGMAESVAAVIMIGFSVDYVVHIANSYVESEFTTRDEKIQQALREMGISVIAGGCTTAGASFFLWGALNTFFSKFATMITLTITSSWVWSLFYFAGLCSLFGPEGNAGSLAPLFSMCKGKKTATALRQ